MKIKYTQAIILAFITLAGVIIGCGHPQLVSEAEEEAIYLLVGEPCSEGDYTTAIRRADSLLQEKQMSDTLTAYIMIDRDVSILEYGNMKWADEYADTIIDFGKKRGIGLAVMQSLQNKGIVARRSGDYDTAISNYKEGLEIADAEQDEEMQQVFSEMLAIACAEQGLYEEATSFGKRSLYLSQDAGDPLGELNSVATLGGIMAKAGQYQEAIDQLLPYHEQSKGARAAYRVKYLTPLMRSFLQLDSLQRVHQLLEETYTALEGMPRNTQAYLVAVNTEASLAAKERRYPDQWRWLQTADSIGTMGTSPDIWYSTRAECLANLGRYQDAYDMQIKAISALDSIRTAENDRRLSELMVKYDTLNKEASIARLKTQRLGWILVALVCLAAVSILTILIINIRRRNSLRLEQERREEYLKGLEHERSRIARELHDDIAGSLVGLQLRLRPSLDKDSEDLLVKLTRRVRTMSHELMPPEFSKKNFHEMITDFVTRFNGDNTTPNLHLKETGSFEWEKLSPEESLELYRVVQESVNNALTHDDNGDITISLSGDDKWQMKIASSMNEDNSKPGDAEGIGLRSINDRAAILGAAITTTVTDNLYIIKLTKEK